MDISLQQGAVHFIDLTDHTSPSSLTIKDVHPVIIIQATYKFGDNCRNMIVVPCTSFNPDRHWNASKQRLKYFNHYLLRASKYSKLKNDTIVKCEQIYTLDRVYFDNYSFTIDNEDLKGIIRRIIWVFGLERLSTQSR